MLKSYKIKSYFSKEWLLYNFLIFITYYFPAIFGMNYAHYEGAALIWAPSGIAIASVFIFGYKIWPAIFIGAFALNFQILSSLSFSLLDISLGALLCSIGNTLEAIIGYFAVNKLTNKTHPFKDIFNIIIFLLFGMIIPSLISSSIGVFSYSNITYNIETSLAFWINWFIGDVGGIIILTPLILNFKKEELLLTKKPKLIEFILLTIFLYFIVNIFFVTNFILPLSITLPILLIFMFRFGKFEAALSVFILSIFSLLILNNPNNIFNQIYPHNPLIPLTILLISTAITSLIVSTILSEDRAIKNELTNKNTELKRWFQVTMNREKRNIELKKEVNELLEKQGSQKKYSTK